MRVLTLLGALLVAGCASTADSDRVGAPASRPAVDLDAVPAVDLARHSVPLRDVVFDTFDGSFLRLPDSSQTERRRLLDMIPPIYEPEYGEAEALPWLDDDDLVVGYVGPDGQAFAYPLPILDRHELVNDVIAGEPVLVSYCPLCASAVVYSRELEGRSLLFGNTSALYESDLVMFDHGSGSYWFQVEGEAIVGTLTGERLRPLPSTTLAWGAWKELHPRTRLLAADGGRRFDERYDGDLFAGYGAQLDAGQFPFPVSKKRLDERLPASEVVVAVEAGSARKAYAPRLIGPGAVNDVLGGRAIVLFVPEAGFAAAFAAEVDGRRLSFEGSGATFRDRETGSSWDVSGRAVAGPLEGEALEPLPSRRAFWFSIGLATPGIALYGS